MNGLFCCIIYYADVLGVFSTYFKNGTWAGNGYLEAGLIALGMMALGLIVFYLLIGNLSFRMSRSSTWMIVGIIAGVLTFVLTDINTGIAPGSKYGMQKVLKEQFDKKTRGVDRESAQYKELDKCRKDHLKHFRSGVFHVSPVLQLCVVSTLATLLLYVGLSFMRPVRRGLRNKYAQNIPIK